jgi:hypothetical protein
MIVISAPGFMLAHVCALSCTEGPSDPWGNAEKASISGAPAPQATALKPTNNKQEKKKFNTPDALTSIYPRLQHGFLTESGLTLRQ